MDFNIIINYTGLLLEAFAQYLPMHSFVFYLPVFLVEPVCVGWKSFKHKCFNQLL